MALEVFTGTSVNIPAPGGGTAQSEVQIDNSRNDATGTLAVVDADFSRQAASPSFAVVNIGGSGDTVPQVGIIFPRGVPVFCA